MTRRSCGISALVLATGVFFAPLSQIRTSNDSLYCAGEFLGYNLYWQPESGFKADTAGWELFDPFLPPGSVLAEISLSRLAALSDSLAVYPVVGLSGIVASVMVEQGYWLVCLSQYSGPLPNRFSVPLPGMAQDPLRHNLVSDYVWERCTEVRARDGSQNEYQVELVFGPRGYAQLDGGVLIDQMSRQIGGVGTFAVAFADQNYFASVVMHRTIRAVYLVAPRSIGIDKVRTQIEDAMDRRGLGLKYKLPKIGPAIDSKH